MAIKPDNNVSTFYVTATDAQTTATKITSVRMTCSIRNTGLTSVIANTIDNLSRRMRAIPTSRSACSIAIRSVHRFHLTGNTGKSASSGSLYLKRSAKKQKRFLFTFFTLASLWPFKTKSFFRRLRMHSRSPDKTNRQNK